MRSTIRRLTLASGLAATLALTAGAARADECQTPDGMGRTLARSLRARRSADADVRSVGLDPVDAEVRRPLHVAGAERRRQPLDEPDLEPEQRL